MKINLFLCLLFLITHNGQAQFANTTNLCFYASGKAIGGDLITQIFISGTSIAEQLATCCYMCRALPECIAWRLVTTNLYCQFFKTVTSIVASVNYYSGKNTAAPFWNCNEQRDRWYFDSTLWTVQPNATSKASLVGCCHDCFWSPTNPRCVSWMYNEQTKDCYHSTKNYNTTGNVFLIGMNTGSVSLSFTSYNNY